MSDRRGEPCECGCGARWPDRCERVELVAAPTRDDPNRRVAVHRRLCKCRCGRRLDVGAHERQVYVNAKHKQRGYREDVKAAAEAAGLPSSLSLETVKATNRTGSSNGDAQRPRARARRAPRPGVSVYFPRAEVLELVLELVGSEPEPSPDRPEREDLEDAVRALTRARDRASKRVRRAA